MKVEQTKLEGVLLITPDVFNDHRGSYVESYNIAEYTAAGIPQLFVQDDFSISEKNVLRGIHGDNKTWKLVSVPQGVVDLVVVNWDNQHPQYKQWQNFWLDEHHYQQVLIPPKFGNGHLVLSHFAIFHYKQTTYYDPSSQFTIPWNDPELAIDWAVKNPITSERDKGHGSQ